MTFIESTKLKIRHALFIAFIFFLAPHAGFAQTTATSLSNGVTIANLSAAAGSNVMYQITVPAGATNLRFVTSGGSGDLDIFTKAGALPSRTSYDAKSDGPTAAEKIAIAAPKTAIYYLLLNGYTAYSGVSLVAAYDVPASNTLTNGVAINNLSGATGSNVMYQITIPAGASNLRFTTTGTNGDLDLFTKANALPTRTSFDAKSDGPTSSEKITIAAPQATTYYLLVNAYAAYSGVSLVAAYDTSTSTSTPTTTTTTLSNGVAINNLSGATGSIKLFQISIPSGASNLRFVTSGGSGGNVDMYEKFSMAVSLTSYDAKSTGSTTAETITVSVPQVGTYNLMLYGASGSYSGVSLMATYDTAVASSPTPAPAPICNLASSTVVPAIATQAAWDAKFDGTYGSTLPALSGGAETFAWQGHYWLRSYVSMAKTYGDTKYLDRAVKTIDYWFANQETSQGWGASINPAQMFLDTGVIAQAVTIFAYEVWNDPRFVAYRPKADAYLAKLEPILHTYDAQWVDGAPYPGSPGFYIYNTCNGLCSSASLVMYNQGATMAKALLLIDRIYRLKGLTPDAGYLHKANAAAAYFKTFARSTSYGYQWDYGGARTNTGIEDISHAHLDLSLVVSAKNFGLGGLNNTDMANLAATMQRVLNGAAGPNDVSLAVDGSGLPTGNYDRVSVGYDWIELVDYDATLFDKTVKVFNTYMANQTGARFLLGWAEIQRKKACVPL